ncbi:MAG: Yip1 family protein [Saccharofermentanales bacterium]
MNRKLSEVTAGIRYSTYVIFHPFKGFWDLKHEKKGNFRSASALVVFLIFIYILRRQFTGFIFNYNVINEMNIIIQITSILFPFLLWCLANWCITTLMDGEGSIKDIYITSAYAFTPILILNIPMLLISNFIILEEMSFYTLIDGISLVWVVFLFLIGIMTLHQFSVKKTILTIIIALVTMIIMITLFLLFFAVITQMVNFFMLIYNELALRS